MKILAIETSCDDTCIAIFETKNSTFLSNVASSQIEVHRKWGGVYPTLARREHQKALVPVLKKALSKADMLKPGRVNKDISAILTKESELKKDLKKFLSEYKIPTIDLLAVTIGPGLDPALWTGINFTKALASAWKKEVVPVNHVKAHFFAPLVLEKAPYPAISMIASGGHTQLILSKNINNHQILGETRDDAAGECFDKTARIIGLPYPGGPEIARMAKKKTKKNVSLPRPMINSDNYDFSFSGLKTAVLYKWKAKKDTDEDFKIAMAKEIQEAITEVLETKTFKAANAFQAKTVVLGGGVSANQLLREKFRKRKDKFKIILPPMGFSTDNAKMIAVTAFYEYQEKGAVSWNSLKSNPNLKIN